MCCGKCCICKTCCCGRSLQDGVFAWALVDIFFHILIFPLPILLAELVFFAPALDLWIFFVVFADIVAIIGEKSGRPAFLTLWLIVFMLNIILLLLIWAGIGATVYLVKKKVFIGPFLNSYTLHYAAAAHSFE